MNDDVIIIGAGGHGKVIGEIIMLSGKNLIGYIDDKKEKGPFGKPVIGKLEDCDKYKNKTKIIVGIGDNKRRNEIFTSLKKRGFKFVNAIHPNTVISEQVEIGEGVVIAAGVVINPGAVIKDNVILNTSSSIDHDCIIDKSVHISPGVNLAGGVKVGIGTHIGIGSVVIPEKEIGEWCVIGAGAVVIENIAPHSLAVGVPAKVVKKI